MKTKNNIISFVSNISNIFLKFFWSNFEEGMAKLQKINDQAEDSYFFILYKEHQESSRK